MNLGKLRLEVNIDRFEIIVPGVRNKREGITYCNSDNMQ